MCFSHNITFFLKMCLCQFGSGLFCRTVAIMCFEYFQNHFVSCIGCYRPMLSWRPQLLPPARRVYRRPRPLRIDGCTLTTRSSTRFGFHFISLQSCVLLFCPVRWIYDSSLLWLDFCEAGDCGERAGAKLARDCLHFVLCPR